MELGNEEEERVMERGAWSDHNITPMGGTRYALQHLRGQQQVDPTISFLGIGIEGIIPLMPC